MNSIRIAIGIGILAGVGLTALSVFGDCERGPQVFELVGHLLAEILTIGFTLALCSAEHQRRSRWLTWGLFIAFWGFALALNFRLFGERGRDLADFLLSGWALGACIWALLYSRRNRPKSLV